MPSWKKTIESEWQTGDKESNIASRIQQRNSHKEKVQRKAVADSPAVEIDI